MSIFKARGRSCPVLEVTPARDNRVMPLEFVNQQHMLITYRYGEQTKAQVVPMDNDFFAKAQNQKNTYILADEQGIVAINGMRKKRLRQVGYLALVCVLCAILWWLN